MSEKAFSFSSIACPFCQENFSLPNTLLIQCPKCSRRFLLESENFSLEKLLKKQEDSDLLLSCLPQSDLITSKAETKRLKKMDQGPEIPETAYLFLEKNQKDRRNETEFSWTPFEIFQQSISAPESDLESKLDSVQDEPLTGIHLIGQVVFKLERKLAEGGMGTIYQAKMACGDGFEKTVVLKILRKKYSQNQKMLEMFVSEARVMADLKHHNISAIHSFGKFRGLYFYAMEYIEGRDLYAFQKRHQKLTRSAPIGILVYIVAQICNALNYIHTKRDNRGKSLELIHRDISPQNIMFSADGVVKLMDFGVAKSKSIASSQKKALAGKLNYTAPEIALFQEVDHRADIYSLGVLFYELVTGRLPFQWNNPVEMNQNIETAEFEPPHLYFPEIPEEVERIILKAMEKKPENRWEDAASMGFALNRYLYSKGFLLNEQTLANYLKKVFRNLDHQVITSEKEDWVDIEMARQAMEKYAISNFQLRECLKEQADLSCKGEYVNLGALFIKHQLLNLEQFQGLLKIQGIQVMHCPACTNQYYAHSFKGVRNQSCLRCATLLEIPEKLKTALVDGYLFEEF